MLYKQSPELPFRALLVFNYCFTWYKVEERLSLGFTLAFFMNAFLIALLRSFLRLIVL